MRIGLLVRAVALGMMLGLGACIGGAPVEMEAGNPASRDVAPGVVYLPGAIGTYRSAEDFGK